MPEGHAQFSANNATRIAACVVMTTFRIFILEWSSDSEDYPRGAFCQAAYLQRATGHVFSLQHDHAGKNASNDKACPALQHCRPCCNDGTFPACR